MTTNNIKFWLEDKELKTPIHDEMVLWTFDNVVKILTTLGIFKPPKIEYTCKTGNQYSIGIYGTWDWSKKEYEKHDEKQYDKYDNDRFVEQKKEVEQAYDSFVKKVEENTKKVRIEKEVEYALKGYKDWNVGFIDLKVTFFLELLDNYEWFNESFEDWQKEGWKYVDGDCIKEFYFEIKPEIKSIGEIMRQINFYRKYANGYFILVTKTKGLKDFFKTQDVYVYEYNKEGDEDGKK